MSPVRKLETLSEMYDHYLRYAKDKHLPEEQRPSPTACWPKGHIEALARYRTWLLSGGTSPNTTQMIYLKGAGHVLGLNLKPVDQINLESDFERAKNYIQSKNCSKEWTKLNELAILKFRKFLMHERGMVENKVTVYDPLVHTEGLPEWLVTALMEYQSTQQIQWRVARLQESIRTYWVTHLCIWRFLVENYQIESVTSLNRKMLYAFVNERLTLGSSPKGVNYYLRVLHGFLGFLEDQGMEIPLSVMRFPNLKEPEPLPKFLTDEQVMQVKNVFEKRVLEAKKATFKARCTLKPSYILSFMAKCFTNQ